MPVQNYPAENFDEEVKSLSKTKAQISKSNVKKKKSVNTMQDDLAGLITKKNKPKRKIVETFSSSSASDVEIQRKLTEVYTDKDGAIPDLTKLEKNERPLWKTILYSLIGVFSVFLIVALAGFFVFSKLETNNFTNEKISLKIDTPITIVSGQEGLYTITITNKEKVNLYNLDLELFYPDNFEYVDSLPKASGDKNNKWNFSVLNIGESKTIELKGKTIAALNSTQTFRGVLNFKPANLNANFKQETIVDVIVSSSVLSLDIEGPDKALANQDLEYILKYENLSEEVFSDIQIVVDYSESFVFSSSEPAASKETNDIWDIKELKAGEKGEIKIKGNYSTAEFGGNRDFVARMQLNYNNDYYPQNEETLITNVIKDQLSLQLITNGSAEDQSIGLGDLLVYTLHYKNTGEESLENIQIKATLNSEILDWSTLKDENNGTVDKNSIIWIGRNVPKLLKLGANEEGDISWQIRVSDASVVGDSKIGKFSVESYIEAKANQKGQLTGESSVITKSIINSVNSDLAIEAVARYYDEENVPLGLGPTEPRVGEESTYNIYLQLSNSLHDVENVQVRSKLPNNVSWSNRENHDIGDLSYNAATNEVIWNISNLKRSAKDVIASFNINIKPTNNDRGRVLILLSGISLSAKDSNTGTLITKDVKAITTSFDDPILGKIKGIVQ
ncbi:hypothetical protein GW933_02010 [Candidatus Falkowbacteria bacterium]|uniref:DUF11 domain-containing protein n=1 Tax=Candidatus Buchananbacteria bacterium CG10_big_fil_rev_8_21_14_0_10_33_19 TaxID=1974525 RepID=A0A2H0W3S7_9BACT|nr:hypothetical protein [Candidatus Falkowbacteria bacterium]PIS06022.1 MAG: hypothetical protein COT80_04630 [Candidatus Buchananbacteria bacterium CG10_big_fil_rev_8_21_14_0_10_33_19]